ncbi:MAG: DUF3793 family protein [Lachnospiraceae bacterium]
MEALRDRLILHCAPVLKGVKSANLVSVPTGSVKQVLEDLNGTGVFCVPIYQGSSELLFLFRRDMLERRMEERTVRRFLEQYGYRDFGSTGILVHLQDRFAAYKKKEQPFPHEMGLFLDYPLKDVENFIRQEGKNFLLNGYWKVYEHAARAGRCFARYDRAREQAVSEAARGCTMAEISHPLSNTEKLCYNKRL